MHNSAYVSKKLLQLTVNTECVIPLPYTDFPFRGVSAPKDIRFISKTALYGAGTTFTVTIIKTLYGSFAIGRITEERFYGMLAEYEAE